MPSLFLDYPSQARIGGRHRMHAAWYERGGPASGALTVGEMDAPRPGPGEVLVRVSA